MRNQSKFSQSNIVLNIINLKVKIVSCFFFLILSYINPIIAKTIDGEKHIGISQIVEHPALNAVREAMLKSLKQQGFIDGKNLHVMYENAQGNIITSTQIASKLLHNEPDVVVGISTSSAQTLFYEARKFNKKIPIVFSAVSDPKSAKLISNENYPITGITDTANLEGLLELINIIMPKLTTLGLMYNPAEVNSVSTIDRLKKLLKQYNIKFIEVTVNKTEDVAQATKNFIGKVDALYFPQDNTLVSAITTIVKITTHSHAGYLPVILPIFTSDPILIKQGVLAAVGYDYEDIGKETGNMVAKILNGESANNILVHNPSELKAVINGSLAKKLGFIIPKKLKYSNVNIIN